MKALGKLEAKPGITLYETEKPEVGLTDVLIKIKKTSICGTDIHIYNWDEWAQKTVPVPLTIGHEFVGEIIEMGKSVKGFSIGDRVTGENHINCGICRNCRAGKRHLCHDIENVGVTKTGCFAEYLSLPASNAFQIPDEVNDDIASIMNPLGNAVHTALSFDLVGEDVLITGAGPVGVMAAAIARHAGARHIVITDINDYRLKLAEKMGATRAINVNKTSIIDVMKKLKIKEGFDVGMEMSGAPSAFNLMIETMNYGGRIGLLAFLPQSTQIDWGKFTMKALTLKGIYGREMYDTWYKMASMIQSGLDVSPLISHHINIDNYKEAFEIMRSGKSGKIILNWES